MVSSAVMLQRLLPVLAMQIVLGQSQLANHTVRNYAAAAGSMALVKDLREKSGAPISDVKSALVEANWDPGGTARGRSDVSLCKHRLASTSALHSV